MHSQNRWKYAPKLSTNENEKRKGDYDLRIIDHNHGKTARCNKPVCPGLKCHLSCVIVYLLRAAVSYVKGLRTWKENRFLGCHWQKKDMPCSQQSSNKVLCSFITLRDAEESLKCAGMSYLTTLHPTITSEPFFSDGWAEGWEGAKRLCGDKDVECNQLFSLTMLRCDWPVVIHMCTWKRSVKVHWISMNSKEVELLQAQ